MTYHDPSGVPAAPAVPGHGSITCHIAAAPHDPEAARKLLERIALDVVALAHDLKLSLQAHDRDDVAADVLLDLLNRLPEYLAKYTWIRTRVELFRFLGVVLERRVGKTWRSRKSAGNRGLIGVGTGDAPANPAADPAATNLPPPDAGLLEEEGDAFLGALSLLLDARAQNPQLPSDRARYEKLRIILRGALDGHDSERIAADIVAAGLLPKCCRETVRRQWNNLVDEGKRLAREHGPPGPPARTVPS